MSRIQQLLARFHRARPRNNDDFRPANLHPAHIDHRALRPNLPAHQLERLRNRNHILHARRNLQSLKLMPPPISHRRNNRLFHSSSHVRLKTRLAHPLNHMLDLLLSSLLRHIDNHCFSPCPRVSVVKNAVDKSKGRDLGRGLWRNLLEFSRLHRPRLPRKRRSRYRAKPVAKLHRKRGKSSHEISCSMLDNNSTTLRRPNRGLERATRITFRDRWMVRARRLPLYLTTNCRC